MKGRGVTTPQGDTELEGKGGIKRGGKSDGLKRTRRMVRRGEGGYCDGAEKSDTLFGLIYT